MLSELSFTKIYFSPHCRRQNPHFPSHDIPALSVWQIKQSVIDVNVDVHRKVYRCYNVYDYQDYCKFAKAVIPIFDLLYLHYLGHVGSACRRSITREIRNFASIWVPLVAVGGSI
jgi:hypothetical protein